MAAAAGAALRAALLAALLLLLLLGALVPTLSTAAAATSAAAVAAATGISAIIGTAAPATGVAAGVETAAWLVVRSSASCTSSMPLSTPAAVSRYCWSAGSVLASFLQTREKGKPFVMVDKAAEVSGNSEVVLMPCGACECAGQLHPCR